MYLPTQFKEESVPAMHAAMRAARIGTLVTMGEDGMEASHVPMLVDPEPAPYGTLRGHARSIGGRFAAELRDLLVRISQLNSRHD